MLILKSLFFLFLFFISTLCNSNINLQIEGLNKELDHNVRKLLNAVNINEVIDENLKKKLVSIIKSGLRPLGYYSPSVIFFMCIVII